MPRAKFSANANYEIEVDASLQSQNREGNYSIIYWRMTVHKTYGYGHMATTNLGNTGRVESNSSQLWSNGNMAYDFRNGSMTGSWIIADGTARVNHDSLGRASYFVSGWLDFYALGSASATTGWRTLPSLATNPPAPRPLSLITKSQTSMEYKFTSTGDGGTPVREWQVGYGTNPNAPQSYISSRGTATINGLQPGKTYYFWSRGRNDIGWSGWSARSSNTSYAGAMVKINGKWVRAIPYVKMNGVWRIAQPYVKQGSIWKPTA